MKIFLDSADPAEMVKHHDQVDGFTTNPVLWRRSGYLGSLDSWQEAVLEAADGKPISLEVTASTLKDMDFEARCFSRWGSNVVVKIPFCTPAGSSTAPIIRTLTRDGITVNATCILTIGAALSCARAGAHIVSVFCGRIADTGMDPEPIMQRIRREITPASQLLWASAREAFNVVQAKRVGADIITLPPDLLAKHALFGRDCGEYALATVKEFCQ